MRRQVVSGVVRKCLTVHHEPLDRLDLRLREARGFLFDEPFVLRDLPQRGVMELLVDSARPRRVADELLWLVREAAERVVPGLHCALAVPVLDGGRWEDRGHHPRAVVHEAAALDVKRELVLLEWLEAAVGTGSVAVGRSRRMTSNTALEHYKLWLPQV